MIGIALIVWSLGYLLEDLVTIVRDLNASKGFVETLLALDFPLLIFRFSVLAGPVIKLVQFFGLAREREDCKEDHLDDFAHIAIGLGSTSSVIRLVYYLQLNIVFGPLFISIKKVIKDVVLVALAFAVFLVAFTLGLYHTLHKPVCGTYGSCPNEQVIDAMKPNQTCADVFNIEENTNQFSSIRSSFRVSFWSLFDPGHPEVIGCSEVRKLFVRTKFCIY